jgi:2-succinyl-5-enolpyruvyl-6-hydroxy-3-cyclohexene-1-carboxylate synthase
VVIDDGYRWKDHTATAHEVQRAAPAALLTELALEAPRVADPEWREGWTRADALTGSVLDQELRKELLEGAILRAAVEALPEGSHLLVGSSMPIRDLDAFVPPRQAELNVYANRGASGIDGLVSTTVGIAAAAEEPVVGVLGDLAFFHDMNGLLALRNERLPVGLVVLNNDGGGIFRTLPVRGFEPAFTRFFLTPHGLDFRAVAGLYGLSFHRVGSVDAFRESFSRLRDSREPFILEVPVPGEAGHRRRREILEAVRTAVSGALTDPGSA